MIYHTHTGATYQISKCGEHVQELVKGRPVPVSASVADEIKRLVREWRW